MTGATTREELEEAGLADVPGDLVDIDVLIGETDARGHTHRHAIRILARAWLRILNACWHNGTFYDPTMHHAHPAQG